MESEGQDPGGTTDPGAVRRISRSGTKSSKETGTRIHAIASPSRDNAKPRLDRSALAGRETFTLTGRVTDTSGTAISAATVTANDATLSATTDITGRYELQNLRTATIAQVAVTHRDHESTAAANVRVDAGPVDFILRPRERSTLIGLVLSWKDRTPVANFNASAEDKTIRKLDEGSGRFEISNAFEQERLRITIAAAGFATQTFFAQMPQRQAQPFEQTFIIGPGSSARGRVVDMSTRAPLAGVPVSLSVSERGTHDTPTTITAITDATGAFSATQLAPGLVRVSVVPTPPLAPFMTRAVLNHNGDHDFGDLLVGAFGTVEGKLVRVPGKQGVQGEQVNIAGENSWPQPVTTLADGSFRFAGLSPGRYTVTLPSRKLHEAITVQSGGLHEVTFRIGSATLNGLVLKNGKPFAAYVQLSRENGGQVVTSARAGDDGRFTVDALSPGYYEAVIFQSGNRGQAQRSRQSFTMPETGTYDHTFHVPGGAIIGKVVGKEENPIPGALVLMLVNNPGVAYQSVPVPTVSATSGGDGSFRIESVDPGKHFLTARVQGLGSAAPTEVVVPPGGADGNIVLRIDPSKTGTLVSTALNFADGSPIPSAWCLLSTPHGRMGHGQQRGADGVIRIEHLPEGEYKVQVSANAFSVAEQTVQIKPGETTEITDVLHETGALRWTAVDENGAGVENVSCTLAPADSASIEQPRHGTTDQSGLWAVRGLIPGSYVLTAGGTSKIPITITPRQLTVETTTVY